jgi:O-antigen ligase
MAADSPITGVGFNAYRYAYPTYDPTSGQFGAIRAVHSSWFGTLAETGYPGLALIILNIATALLTCRRVRAESLRSGRRDLAFYAQNLQTSLFAFTIGGSFLSMHYNEMLWHLVGLSAALNLIHRQAVKETAPAPVPVSRPISIPVPATRPAAVAARRTPAARPGPSSPTRSVRR